MVGTWGRLTGTSLLERRNFDTDGEFDDAVGLLRATQEIRIVQAKFNPPLVAVCVALLLVQLRGVVESPLPIVVFGLALVATLVIRALVARRIKRGLASATPVGLRRNETWLFFSGAAASAAMGSGFWLVATSDIAEFYITLSCCLFAIGTMINVSVVERPFLWSLAANIGQGLLFHFRPGIAFDPFVGFVMLALSVLLISFGRANCKRFAESFAMQQRNSRLVRQLDSEKRTVELALGRARDAATEKSRFLAAAGHDLRQPLHAVGLYLGPLLSEVEGTGAEPIVRRITKSTDLLASQLNDLLDLSRLDAGAVKVSPRSFAIDSFLRAVAEDGRTQAVENGLRLNLQLCNAQAWSDPTLLDRVVRNLLSNAIRYTQEGSVTLTAELDRERIRVAVIDTGPGIAESDTGRIFEEFVQLSNPSRASDGGVGLGLASVRRISQLLDLQLQLSSELGRGTEFVFWVPLDGAKASCEEPVAPLASLDEAHLESAVWAIEDDPTVANALELQLRVLGYTVGVARSLRGAKQLREEAGWPHHALIDDMLEGGDSGLELARWMVQHMSSEQRQRTQIVILTGNNDPARLEKLRRSEFRLLQKPLRPGELETVLGKHPLREAWPKLAPSQMG